MRSLFARFFGGNKNTKVQPKVGDAIYVAPPIDNLPRGFILNEGDTISLDEGSDLAGNFLVEKKIEKGGFGTVYKICTAPGERYALKILDFWEKQPMEWPSLKKRFDISFGARHITSDYVVQYHHKGSYKGNPCITMELCEAGNLEDRMNEFAEWSRFPLMATRLLLGLFALHEAGVIHRDIKPKNVLFDKQNRPKITDFDLSAFLTSRLTNPNPRKVTEIWYTPIYAPPEQKDPKRAFLSTTPAMDMFSIGVSFYFTLTRGKLPWGTQESFYESPDAYYAKIDAREYTPINSIRPDLSYEWVKAIHDCLEPIPENRLSGPVQFLERINYRSILSAHDNEHIPSKAEPGTIVTGEPVSDNETDKLTNWSLRILGGCSMTGQTIRLRDLLESTVNSQLYLGRLDESAQDKGSRISFDEFPKDDAHFWVSRRHATLMVTGNKLAIRDGQLDETGSWEASTNGTEIYNPRKGTQREVPADEFEVLAPGDIVYLAGTVNFKIEND
jgi:serine/threonine protein kinase